MFEDPIVEELHAIREKLLEEHGGLEGYIAHLREIERELGARVVSRPPKTPAPKREVG